MDVTLHKGNVMDVLDRMEPESVHTCVTSIPYWALREYGCPVLWPSPDGVPLCEGEHRWVPAGVRKQRGQDAGESAQVGNTKKRVSPPTSSMGMFCVDCGAWHGEYGLEPTYSLYVSHTVMWMEKLKRVLRDDGTVWLNVGDSYAAGKNGRAAKDVKALGADDRTFRDKPFSTTGIGDLKEGDLAQIPSRLAIALQANGWVVRSEIIWCKTSPLPESVYGTRFVRHKLKRPGPDHDKWQAAMAEALARHDGDKRKAGAETRQLRDKNGWKVWEEEDCPGCAKCEPYDKHLLLKGRGRPTNAIEKIYLLTKAKRRYYYDLEAVRSKNGIEGDTLGHNLWNYWTDINTEPSRDEHYASFPTKIPQRCIAAATSERGVCPRCGAQWARILQKRTLERWELPPGHPYHRPARYVMGKAEKQKGGGQRLTKVETIGWRQSCRCVCDKCDGDGVVVAGWDADAHENKEAPRPHCHKGVPKSVPAVVLDPFCGSGSTLLAAHRSGRRAVGIDLVDDYHSIATKRIKQEAPLFAQIEER